EAFLASSDILSLNAPATPQTRGWLSRERLALLPRGAVVVNTARGGLIDDEALIEALGTGRVAAAGLDVYSGEPDIPAGYLGLDNVVIRPHLGSATTRTRNAMGDLALGGIDAV